MPSESATMGPAQGFPTGCRMESPVNDAFSIDVGGYVAAATYRP